MGWGFFVFVAGWCPFSRLLELKNTKTAGRDFFAEMPTLGFRILGFVFLDSSWCTPHPALQHCGWVNVGLCHRSFPFMGVYVGESLRAKCLVIAFLVMVVAFIKG
ncbi:hypothetical protein BU169_10550 [Corynebacterium diphtheriae]|nr:hypothetical protein BU161_09870 [Corynebacterium diphtheriae]OWM51692.1 hypothetical protein BU169_10550 [Corynebacterium diphtheriae]